MLAEENDPCKQGCRAPAINTGGTFVYNCDGLPDPAFFGLPTFNLTVASSPWPGYVYALYNGDVENGLLILLFDYVTGSANGFTRVHIVNSNNGFIASTEPDAGRSAALIINKGDVISPPDVKPPVVVPSGVTWRIGATFAGWTSCLLVLPDYVSCNSPNSFAIAEKQTELVTFPCPNLPSASRYNLNNYDLIFLYLNQRYEIYVDPAGTSILAATVTLDSTGAFVDATSEDTRFNVYHTNSVLTIELPNGPLWKVLSSSLSLYSIVFVPKPSLGGIPIRQPPISAPGCPTLFGELFLTPDQKQLCQTNFTLTFYNQTSLQSKVNSAFNKQERDYVFYCTDILSVVQGEGCTLAEKAAALTDENRSVTVAGLATYGMLRLMLSFLLFGRFDLNLLRQEYYKCFLKKLGKSGFCAYKPLFLSSPYWRYFIR